MPDFKTMSLGQLMMWVGGGFAAVVILMIVVLKVVQGPKIPKAPVRTTPTFTPVVAAPVMTEEEAQALLAGHRNLEAHGQTVAEAVNTIVAAVSEVKNDLAYSNQNLEALYNRVLVLEERMDKADKARASSRGARASARIDRSNQAAAGNEIVAITPGRVWIQAGQEHDSATVGDNLPSPKGRRVAKATPVDRSDLTVREIDATSGIVTAGKP